MLELTAISWTDDERAFTKFCGRRKHPTRSQIVREFHGSLKPEGLLLSSQELATDSYAEPNESSLYTSTISSEDTA
jgi:hypothetical protein